MQSLNILIAGDGVSASIFLKSKMLKKLYVTSDNEISGAINISFNTFKELAEKCRTLQVDIVIVENEKWVIQGICDVLRKNLVNCFAVSAKWTELLNKKLLYKYDIKTPLTLTYPKPPLCVKSGKICKKANSLAEVVEIKKEIFQTSAELAKNIFLEEYLEGEEYTVTSLFDGKNLLTFPSKNMTNLQKELLADYSSKLELVFVDYKADFVGFVNSNLIWAGKSWYNTGFSFGFLKPEIDNDLIYILNSALYQKLNEINSSFLQNF